MKLFEAATRALTAGPGPVLLVADDLHAADRPTLQLLHYVLRSRLDVPLLVAATARLAETAQAAPVHEFLTALRALDRCTDMALDRLAPAETSTLAERLLRHEITPEQRHSICAKTAGNPLFVLETVRAGWPGHADADVLTPKMQSVLEARLQQLSPGARDLLGVAAVAGWPVPVDVLSRVGGEPGTARDLDELWRRQLLVTAAADTYDFGHDKLREVALLGLSPAALRRNHRLLAHALEQACAADLDAVAGRIAAHLGAGGETGSAAGWYERAAVAARHLYADAEAVSLLDRAIGLVRAAPGISQREELELRLLTAVCGPLAAAYGYASDQMSAVLDRAAVLARELGVNLPGPLLRAQAMAVLSGGDFDAALEAGARLGAHGGSEPLSVVEGGFVQGVASYWRGELAAAKAHLESAVAAYRPKRLR